jgi:hypothetical protein
MPGVHSFELMSLSVQAAAQILEIVSPDLCREELERVLASQAFSKAMRLRDLLEYIGDCSIKGKLDALTEQQIGMRVFERSPSYNSTEDTIVRVTARHLRERLDLYYREEGRDNPLRLAVPKGSYVATFRLTETSLAASGSFAPPLAQDVPPQAESGATKIAPAGRTRWPPSAWLALLACVSLAIALTLLADQHFRPQPNPQAQQALQPFGPPILWQALFTPGRRTFIVPGDAALDIYTAWEQRSVPLVDYTNQYYQGHVTVSRPPHHNDVPLSVRSITPMADLRMVADLVRVPEWMGQPAWDDWIEVCYARDMVVANTHNNNLILIGSSTFNPWVALYQPALDFDVHWDFTRDVYYVSNRAPKPGEQSQYVYDRSTGAQAYTLVALTDNLQGEGRVLLIEGTTMGSTYGGLNFFTNEKLWQPVIHAATGKDGKLHSFEVLLSSDFVRGGTSNTHLVTFHLHG